eukprot:1165381-Rhodomonas_salina.3
MSMHAEMRCKTPSTRCAEQRGSCLCGLVDRSVDVTPRNQRQEDAFLCMSVKCQMSGRELAHLRRGLRLPREADERSTW